jgi:hypothetical protein
MIIKPSRCMQNLDMEESSIRRTWFRVQVSGVLERKLVA